MTFRKNYLLNLTGNIIPVLISLITIPIYLKLIGESRYGILSIFWLFLGYLGLFDLGLGRAAAQRIAALKHDKDNIQDQVFWTALIISGGIGICVSILSLPFILYFNDGLFKFEGIIENEAEVIFICLAMALPMITINSVLVGVLQGKEVFLELNVISSIGSILFQLLPILSAMIWSGDLRFVLPAAIFAKLITILTLFYYSKINICTTKVVEFNILEAKKMVGFGGWVTVTSIISPLMVALDRFVIGAISGAKAVTYYSVPFQLAEKSTLISNALSLILFPKFTNLPEKKVKKLAEQGLILIIALLTPLVVIGIYLMDPFLDWWISEEFSKNASQVGIVLLLGFWINSLAYIPYSQLQGIGRPDLVAKCHLAEFFPYCALMYLGLTSFGLIGAAIVFSIRTFIDFTLLSYLSGNLRCSIYILFFPSLQILLACINSGLFEAYIPDGIWVSLFQFMILFVWLYYLVAKKNVFDELINK